MSTLRLTVLILDAFVALTAVGGGVALATGLEGGRFPPSMLAGTPFRSYLVPGLILAVVVGGAAAVAVVATAWSPTDGALPSLLAGGLLMGFIVGEVLLLDQPGWSWTEFVYFTLGAAMALLGVRLAVT